MQVGDDLGLHGGVSASCARPATAPPVKWRQAMLRSRIGAPEKSPCSAVASAFAATMLPCGIEDHHRHVGEPVEHALHARRDVAVDRARRPARLAGHAEQVRALVVGQPQRARERREHRRRRVRRAALLEPRQVVDRDARELRDLLAPQAGRASPAAGRQPDVGGAEAVAPGAQAGGRARAGPRSDDGARAARQGGPVSPRMARPLVRPRRSRHAGGHDHDTDHRSQQGPRARGRPPPARGRARRWVGARDPDRGRAAAEELGARFVAARRDRRRQRRRRRRAGRGRGGPGRARQQRRHRRRLASRCREITTATTCARVFDDERVRHRARDPGLPAAARALAPTR